MNRSLSFVLATLLFASGAVACSDDAGGSEDAEPTTPGSTRGGAPGANRPPPPTVTVELPSFPPIGPLARVTAVVRGATDVALLDTTFRTLSTRNVTLRDGEGATTFDARQLGEGRGTLVFQVCDLFRSSCSASAVENLIVDLTPPELEVERRVASPFATGPSGEIALWAADDWVLGRVRLTFGGKTLERVFPAAWPSTIGEAWDVSRVGFPAKDLPEGDGTATVVVEDAAGNRLERALSIRVDATSPSAEMTAPLAGARLARGAPLAVRASASDPGSGPAPTLEVWVGGARIAELAGPSIDLDVDTGALPSGPLEVRVVPRDEAGNVGAAVLRTVVVE